VETNSTMTARIVPGRTVLLLLDLQVIHIKMIPNIDMVLDRTASVIKTARQKGITVAHCRVAFSDSESANLPKTNFLLHQLSRSPQRLAMMNESSPGTAFCPEVAPEKGDLVLRKTRVGLFLQGPTENLHSELKERGIDTIVMGGVATGGAVLVRLWRLLGAFRRDTTMALISRFFIKVLLEQFKYPNTFRYYYSKQQCTSLTVCYSRLGFARQLYHDQLEQFLADSAS